MKRLLLSPANVRVRQGCAARNPGPARTEDRPFDGVASGFNQMRLWIFPFGPSRSPKLEAWRAKRRIMKSDFAAVCRHLEHAYQSLSGTDETSLKGRAAIDLLIETMLVAKHARPSGKIVQFPIRRRTNGRQ